MTYNIHKFFILALLLALPNISYAGGDKFEGTIITLSENNSVSVTENLLLSDLKFSTTEKDPQTLQNNINVTMTKAFALIDQYKDVNLITKQYSVYQTYDTRNKERIEKWIGQQSVTLSSENSKDLLKLVGELQSMGLTVNSLKHQISREKREEVKNSLIEPTITKLTNKAKEIAKALGKSEIEILTLNVGSFFPNSIMHNNVSSMKISQYDIATPVAPAGKGSVSVNVSAKILIKD